jgi:hypothetical protein
MNNPNMEYDDMAPEDQSFESFGAAVRGIWYGNKTAKEKAKKIAAIALLLLEGPSYDDAGDDDEDAVDPTEHRQGVKDNRLESIKNDARRLQGLLPMSRYPNRRYGLDENDVLENVIEKHQSGKAARDARKLQGLPPLPSPTDHQSTRAARDAKRLTSFHH